MDKIRIAISGIGGVGGYYGGKLANYYQQGAVAEVFFIARNENLLAIKQKGLRVETPTESFTAFPALVTDSPQDIGVVDYLFLCTKSYDLETNIAQLQPLIGQDTILIPLLNGGNITEQIQSILPYNEIWQGCVYIGSRLTEPGLITKFTEKDQLYFGSCGGNEQQQHQLLSLLTDAGINANNPEDITQRIWEKFLRISTAATITSYYNQSIGKVIENHYDDFLKLGNEFISVAKAKGINFPENSCVRTIEAQKMMPYESTTSMHTDFIKGKPTELETITGYIVRCAKEFNIQVPTYSLMYNELKENKIKPGYPL
jgi:2-dehydropantoate 2-reductase